jgi:hypothetical protein
MYSNSKDQKSIEDLYSKILSEDFGESGPQRSEEEAGYAYSPEKDENVNTPDSGSDIESNLHKAFKSGTFANVNTESDEEINRAIQQILGGNIPEVEESTPDFSHDDENVGEDHLPESYNTANYLSAAGKKKKILSESNSSTSHYMPKKK